MYLDSLGLNKINGWWLPILFDPKKAMHNLNHKPSGYSTPLGCIKFSFRHQGVI